MNRTMIVIVGLGVFAASAAFAEIERVKNGLIVLASGGTPPEVQLDNLIPALQEMLIINKDAFDYAAPIIETPARDKSYVPFRYSVTLRTAALSREAVYLALFAYT